MSADGISGTGRHGPLVHRIWAALAAVLFVQCSPAAAYIGPSHFRLGDADLTPEGSGFEGWFRAESHYWTQEVELPEIRGINAAKDDLLFTVPAAPAQGSGFLAISIDKSRPAYDSMMDLCRAGQRIARATFAESSELARHPQEHGPKPDSVPSHYFYRLKDIRLECPEAQGAPEQAFALYFDDIEWLNFAPLSKSMRISASAAELGSLPITGLSRVFAITWFAASIDSHPDQCPRMNRKADDADYFRFLSEKEVTLARSLFGESGVGPERMAFRGPAGLNVALMPGIVPDPGHESPLGEVINGFDLDKEDGAGPPPQGVRRHRDFMSPDGRTGIDNQLFTVEGCVEGLRRSGFLPTIFNEGRAVGRPTALVEISGIDDEHDDDEVIVTFYFSEDYLRRSPMKVALPHYTYRISRNPEFSQDFARFRGRIVNGIVLTEPIESLHVHEVTAIETTIYRPRLRIELLPDGSMKGLIGGYLDWRRRVVWQTFRAADYENTIGFQAPAIYNAMKRAADGLQDPVTGEYNGISAAFEIEGVAAFVTPQRGTGHFAQRAQIMTEQD
ncbi:MAG: hypothetical protein P8J20_00335 [Novosphingobium sp.]|nr:hypothetical protein [Novosphingobium sp.]